MTHIHQLCPQIPVETAKGPGMCVAWLDYTEDHNTLWKVCITETGEFWDLPQSQVRGVQNISMGRMKKNVPTVVTP